MRTLLAASLAAVSVLAMAVPATADTGGDLYVDSSSSRCSDTAPVADGAPLCTIQRAADIAAPGTTVHVNYGNYGETDITRSGITFVGVPSPNSTGTVVHRPEVGRSSDGLLNVAHAFVVTGASDIKISGFDAYGTSGAVVLTDATRVTVDGDVIGSSSDGTGAGISVAGHSSAVTIIRDQVAGCDAGITIGQGVTGAVVTTNRILANQGVGVAVTDATGVDVVGNSIFRNAVAGVSVDGASSATVENNILSQDVQTTPTTTGELTVAAASAAGTTADYNLLYDSKAGIPLYTWSGATYTTPAAFTAATGQGHHDLNADPKFTSAYSGVPTEGSPEVDSADANAPGEQATDFNGDPRLDDPLVANTGVGVHDRGAVELQDPYKFDVTADPVQGPYPLPVTLSVNETNPWSTPMTFTYTFDDGSTPGAVVTTAKSVSHTYTQVSVKYQYNALVKAAAPSGKVYPGGTIIDVTTPAPFVAAIRATQTGPLTVDTDVSASTDSWKITDYSIDFGDGTAPRHSTAVKDSHSYATPGTYTVTVTETDNDGQHATAKQTVTVAGAYVPDGPVRLLDTRNGGTLGPGGRLSLKVTGANGVPADGISAVVVNLTATNPTASSFLTAYPDGSAQPTTSNLNFSAGQTVPNLVTVPVGADGSIDIANHVGSVDVVVDLEGYYQTTPARVVGGAFNPVTPERLLDTRVGAWNWPAGPVGPGQSVELDADPSTWPLGNYQAASAVMLNVTVTNPTASSFLTVYANGSPVPTASNLNFTAGQTTSNLVIVPVDAANRVQFYNHAGRVDVVADIEGFFTTFDTVAPTGTAFTPLAPTRLLDTRSAQPVGPNGTYRLPIAGGVPAGAKAVVLNVTVADATAASFLTVYPGGAGLPDTSDLNFDAGAITQNQVVVPIGADGTVQLHNHTGSVDVIVDAFGFYGP